LKALPSTPKTAARRAVRYGSSRWTILPATRLRGRTNAGDQQLARTPGAVALLGTHCAAERAWGGLAQAVRDREARAPEGNQMPFRLNLDGAIAGLNDAPCARRSDTPRAMRPTRATLRPRKTGARVIVLPGSLFQANPTVRNTTEASPWTSIVPGGYLPREARRQRRPRPPTGHRGSRELTRMSGFASAPVPPSFAQGAASQVVSRRTARLIVGLLIRGNQTLIACRGLLRGHTRRTRCR
jgi:hypothetical protein